MKTLTRTLITILFAALFWEYAVFIEADHYPPISQEELDTAAKQPGLAKVGTPCKTGNGANAKVKINIKWRERRILEG
jgi:hypothetical protein